MLKTQGSLLLALTLSALLMTFCGNQESGESDSSLEGIVIDEANVPLRGAIVRAEHLETGIATVVLTDPGGNFWTPPLTEGQYEIRVGKKGFRPYGPTTIDLNGDTDALEVNLVSFPTIPTSQLTDADILPHLPEDDGKMELFGVCTSCHNFETILSRVGRSQDEWKETIKSMSSILGGYTTANRLNETNPNTVAILGYLSKYFGPGSILPKELGSKVKEAYREELPIGHDVIYREYELPTPKALPHTAVPDGKGNVWFTEYGARKIGRLEISTGKITEYALKRPGQVPHGLTVGPDGIVWFPGYSSLLGRFDPKTETMEELVVPDRNGKSPMPHSVIVDKNGQVWFTEADFTGEGGSISSFDPVESQFTRYMVGEGNSPYGIIEHEGLIWFAINRPGKIGFLNPETSEMQMYDVPTRDSSSRRLRFDTKGRLWFGEQGKDKIGMFDPSSKEFTEYDLPFSGSPYSIHVDKRTGYVWVASFHRDSLIRFDPDKNEMIEYPLPGVGAHVRDIWPDEQGRMWFVQWGRNKVTSAEHVQVMERH